MRTLPTRIILAGVLLWGGGDFLQAQDLDARTLFETRVRPILRSQEPSSCTACHLSGVELRDYIREDPGETFALLRQAGWVNLDRPEESKLLQMIARRPAHPTPLQEQVQARELAAFSDWLRLAVRDPAMLRAAAPGKLGTELPVEVIRHARQDRVLQSFVDNIWSETGRCVNCHSPERNRGKIEKLGREQVEAISWIVPNDPAATLERLVAAGDIDLDHPDQSPLLTKPSGREQHGGGVKFQPGDTAYRKFLAFLTDYAAVRRGGYRTVEQLPAPPAERILLTEQHLRITGFPPQLGEIPWQVDLYAWDHQARTWGQRRIGTVFGKINTRDHLGQGMVSVVLPRDHQLDQRFRDAPRLPSGPWLARIYLDRAQKTRHDPLAVLGEGDLAGEVEIRGDWPPGYQPPKIIAFPGSKD